MKLVTTLFAGLILLAVSPSYLWAQGSPNEREGRTIEGNVYVGESNRPASDVMVGLYNAEESSLDEARTGSNGEFAFRGLHPGSYMLDVYKRQSSSRAGSSTAIRRPRNSISSKVSPRKSLMRCKPIQLCGRIRRSLLPRTKAVAITTPVMCSHSTSSVMALGSYFSSCHPTRRVGASHTTMRIMCLFSNSSNGIGVCLL